MKLWLLYRSSSYKLLSSRYDTKTTVALICWSISTLYLAFDEFCSRKILISDKQYCYQSSHISSLTRPQSPLFHTLVYNNTSCYGLESISFLYVLLWVPARNKLTELSITIGELIIRNPIMIKIKIISDLDCGSKLVIKKKL